MCKKKQKKHSSIIETYKHVYIFFPHVGDYYIGVILTWDSIINVAVSHIY